MAFFAHVARYILPTNSTLLSLKIVVDHGNAWNYHWRLASLSTSNAHLYPLYAAIRETTAHFKTMKNLALAGTVNESLFWPSVNPTIVEPFWQNLECFDIQFHMTRASGGWYFSLTACFVSIRLQGGIPLERIEQRVCLLLKHRACETR
ncbi:hypothetical protein QBC33DRAFT_551353 [Phialemonium atrogriseum]|uniref:Uncharacterized protein n=1 Tax=Phialemonium atrogriseum TaxID=1093897 RepID=A0AAJ0BVB3_9PEZI|nr:uncharacterized protein QBC33DRAFT_551353 [Phialemonium atrogriseum]KAK1762726.1 hypothetical protein QBC33DRAFT_551353 [Phialemonium atrogriseum]